MPRTRLQKHVDRLTEQDCDRITRENAEAAELQRQANEKWLADHAAEMEACRKEFEREQAQAEAKAKTKPGPKPRVDQDGRRVVTERGTRGHADLKTRAEHAAEIEKLEAIVGDDEADWMTDPNVPVPYGAIVGGGSRAPRAPEDDTSGTGAPAAMEVIRTTVANGREVLSPTFKARRKVEPDPAEGALAMPRIEEHEYRIIGDQWNHYLEQLVDGAWQDQMSGYDASTVALHFARRGLVPDPEFSEYVRQLPVSRPARAAQLERERDTSAKPSLTPEQKAENNARIKASMIQERTNRAQREREAEVYGGSKNLSWI